MSNSDEPLYVSNGAYESIKSRKKRIREEIEGRGIPQKVIRQYSPQKRIWRSSYVNSRNKGIVHKIKVRDIPTPEVCEYLGVTLDYSKKTDRSIRRASIDRIDSKVGYIPENIQVISDLANRIKTDATPEQLLAFARNMLRLHGDATEQKKYKNGGVPFSCD